MLLGLVLVVIAAKAAKPPQVAPPAPIAAPVCPEVPVAPARPSTVRVMLPDLEATGRYAATKQALTQLLAEQAATVRGFELLSAAEVRAVLDQEANKQLVGCNATSCLAEVAEALDADLIVSGRVEGGDDGALPGSPPGSTLVSLSLVNARAIVVVNRVNVVWRGDEGRLPDVVRTSAQLLLVDGKDRKPGKLVVANLSDTAHVLVDGVDQGRDLRHGGLSLDVGVHEVAIDDVDKLPLTTWAIVESDKEASVDGSLEDVPVPQVWLWIGGAAAVVVGAVATGAVLYLAGDGDVSLTAPSTGTSAANVEALRGLGAK